MKRACVSPFFGIVFLCTLFFTGLPVHADAVAVSVHEFGTGKPIAGAKVTLGSGKTKQDLYTGDDGTVPVSVTNKTRLLLQAASDGYASVSMNWYQRSPTDTMPKTVDLQLEKAVSISGSVVDDTGNPLAGAKVLCVVDKKYANGQRLAASWTTATADALGNWSFATLPDKFDSIQLDAYHRECIGEQSFYRLENFKDIPSLRNGTATIKLTRGTPIQITVTDENGKPIRNATIAYGEERGGSNTYPVEKTNAQGICKLGIVAGINATLTVQAKGFSPDLKRILIGDKAQSVTFALAAGHLLEGTVVDDAGNPAPNASVYIDTWRGARTISRSIKADADGHFVWNEAPADEIKADVVTQHGEKRDVSMKAGDENKVTLQAPMNFKGTVVDAATNQPVTNYKITLGISFSKDQPVTWQPGMSEGAFHHDGANFDGTLSAAYAGYAIRIAADGYLPTDSPVFPMSKEFDFTFKMEKGTPITGKVVKADGSPAAGTQVILIASGNNIQMENGILQDWFIRNATTATTSADGSFTLPPQRDDYLLMVTTDTNYAQISRDALQKNSTITLQPWARVEGIAMHGAKPAPGAILDGYSVQTATAATPAGRQQPQIYNRISATADDNGKFVFERVSPGDLSIGISVPINNRSSTTTNQEFVHVDAGKTTTVQIGGKGRTVTGRVVVPADIAAKGFTFQWANIREDRPSANFQMPVDYFLLPADKRSDWMDKWRASDEGKKIIEEQRKSVREKYVNFAVHTDGTFSAEGVTEGNYIVTVMMTRPDNTNRFQVVANANTKFTMPPIPGGVSDEPLDIGTLAAVATGSTSVTMSSPDKPKITTLDGQLWDIDAHKNQHILVYVFSPDSPASDALNETLKPVWEAFGKNESFTILGLIFKADNATAKSYISDHHIPWTVATLDPKDAERALRELAGQNFPAAQLTGPDHGMAGTIAPDKLLATVQDALKPPAPKPAAPTIDPNDKLP